jgi:hypothetical protein
MIADKIIYPLLIQLVRSPNLGGRGLAPSLSGF